MAVAGGGRLQDYAGAASETSEVVLGELREGRNTLPERAMLRLTVPANLRAEVGGLACTPYCQLFGGADRRLPDRRKRTLREWRALARDIDFRNDRAGRIPCESEKG